MKKLHKYAIIPKELYVRREADFNLARIIQQRLKPGYISVSRQMGKSNLLLNAKSDLENADNIFLYLDLSNPPYTSRECFQNIIDTLWETNELVLNEAYNEILQKRKLVSLTPAKEHENELKTILKYFKGNITIILDEVDSLAKINYSDEIFGQIRSIYFIRKTFPSFERLTYILSGVIDPSKLIKNKDNSPFNIADKIFLGDFTYEQYEDFLNRANLSVTKEIRDRIFYWLQGNPRMTYDVSSELEDCILDSKEITVGTIDQLIKKLYLNKFDTPPVDHIRDLVQQNLELRNSIILINFNQSSKLNDEIIGRLYLAGIINNENKDSIKIKNEVIKQALNPDWIDQIEIAQKGLFKIGEEKFHKRDYIGAISSLEDFLLNTNNSSKNILRFANYYLGDCYNKLGEFEKSSEHLQKAQFEKESSQWEYNRVIFLNGMNALGTGNHEEAIKFFDIVINDAPHNDTYLNSLINKGLTLNAENFEKNNIISNEIFLQIIKKTNELGDEISSADSFNSLAYFQLGNTALKKQEYEQATNYFKLASNICEVSYKPAILNFLYLSETQQELKKQYLFEIFNVVKLNNIKFETIATSSLSFNKSLLLLILFEISENNETDLFNSLLEYSTINLVTESKSEIIFEVALLSINLGNQSVAKTLFKLISDSESVNWSVLRANLYLHFLASTKDSKLRYFRRYTSLFQSYNNFKSKIDNLDLSAFINIIGELRETTPNNYENNIDESFMYCKLLEPYLENISQDLEADAIVIYFFIADYYNYKQKAAEAINYAELILKKCQDSLENITDISNAKSKSIKNLQKNANAILLKFKAPFNVPIKQVIIEKKYNRNDIVTVQYQNGQLAVGKFKKFLTEIERGLCSVI